MRGSWPVPEWNVSGRPSSSATAQKRSYSGSLYGRCGTRAGRNSARQPWPREVLRLRDRGVDVEHRDEPDGEEPVLVAEHVHRPVVVGAAQRGLEAGVVGREAGLERERREDDLGAHAVALLVGEAARGVDVADHRLGELAGRHQLARVETLDEQRAPAVAVDDARHAVVVLRRHAVVRTA